MTGNQRRNEGFRKRARNAGLTALLLAFAVVGLAEAPDREEFKKSFEKTVALKAGQKLRVEHSHGKLHVRTHREPQATIRAQIRVSSSDQEGAARFAEDIRIEVSESASGVSVVTRYPEKRWSFTGRGFVSFSVDYDIVMPEAAPLEARNKFGSVDVEGLKASADVKNSNGSIAFRHGRGSLRLENSFGKIDLNNHEGEATVVNSNGGVTVADLKGALELSNRFGGVSVLRSGRSRISNSNGNVVLDGATTADVTSSFGSVNARNIAGDVAVRNNNGSVDVSNVGGNADLASSFAGIRFADVKGSVTCTGTNSRVNGVRAGKTVTVRNTFGAVDITEAEGVDIENSNAKIGVRGIRGGAILTTSFGAIDASDIRGNVTAVNSNASVSLTDIGGSADVRTGFGKVTLNRIHGSVKVSSDNGGVSLLDIRGPANVRTSFGLLDVTRVQGNLLAENSNGAIKASEIQGTVDARTSFASVNVHGARGSVEVTNQNGAVEVTGLPSGCTKLAVKTSFAPIRVHLSEGTGYTVAARTSFGKINTELPVGVSGAVGGESLNGKIGDGRCPLTLTNSNGNIDLLRGGQ